MKSNFLKPLYFETVIKAASSEDGPVKISGYASTNDKDRAGDVILPTAWKSGVGNYLKNPILLFNHNHDRPIGKATNISFDDKGLQIDGEIIEAEAANLIKNDVLRAFSVGFMVKDADYDSKTDVFVIKEAELYEISVVSVPCNQDAVFSVSKSFETSAEYSEFKKQFSSVDTENSVNTQVSVETNNKKEEKKMELKDIEAMLKDVAAETAKSLLAAQKEEATATAKAAEEAKVKKEALQVEVTTAAERLLADVEKRFAEKNEALENIVNELKGELSSKSVEIDKLRESKRHFSDRSSSTADWKKEFEVDMSDAFILGLVTGKGWDTPRAKSLIEKVNAHSGVAVSSADFEQVVSGNIERDIQNALVLAPLFREIPMTSATMILPIMPDSGYAEFVSTATTDAVAPKGNLDVRGTYGAEAGIGMAERTLSTKKLVSLSYLGNETEEDAIIPILGLLRDAMVRSHARSVEHAILAGNSADGVYGTSGASFDGLLALATADSDFTQPAGSYAATDVITTSDLMTLRKNMGKYGLRPEDVIYIVSQDAYFNLLEDSEFQDMNLVGGMATKVKGSIGNVYGSNVIVCDEFAAKAADKFGAIAVNPHNYLIPRLRGLTIESAYETANQRRVLVATQRLGFIDLIDGATSKWGFKYKAA